LKILLLSGYHAVSHKYWSDGLFAALSEHEWHCLTLPPRHFSWRVRGAPLSWLTQQPELLAQQYDLIIATSMVDLATMKGLIPGIAGTACLYYFHENQFEYPKSGHQHPSVDAQMVNLYAALAADRVLFNSAFNRDSFFAGVNRLLAKLPDHRPEAIEPFLNSRCEVLPVPLNDARAAEFSRPVSAGDTTMNDSWQQHWRCEPGATAIKIVWAARWEYDKGPDRLLAVLRELESRGMDYRVCLVGEQFRNSPKEFQTIKQQFDHRIVQFGFVASKQAYQRWLSSADMLLSTSIHEFQGLAVLEAVAAGCVPVLPNRLAYPELVPAEFLYQSSEQDLRREAAAAADLIEYHHRNDTTPPCIKRFMWSELKSQYQRVINQTYQHRRAEIQRLSDQHASDQAEAPVA